MKRHSQAYDYTMILIGSALFAASINLFVVPGNLYRRTVADFPNDAGQPDEPEFQF